MGGASAPQTKMRDNVVEGNRVYHYDPATALEELKDEALLPNPVHVRDMILRTEHSPEQALELNRAFASYQSAYAEAQKLAKSLLEGLAASKRKA
jgi:hypothetical protein